MNITRDKREKLPWGFDIYDVEIELATLKAGDYTLTGFDKYFAIERKRSTGEISANLGLKKTQFENELRILSEYEEAYLICEFPESDLDRFPVGSGIPRKYWRRLRINGGYLRRTLFALCEQYNISLFFFDDRSQAEDYAYHLIKAYHDKINKRSKTKN